ncbi:unnamed protein product [Mesocestoides corti]|uniref:Leucine-rich repeat-containing protein 51 n=1 Tax=Mesocestoides corti TaxID=53468 RepID=A0A0R3UIU6_MESCO|nr:unnamed protein product [Mesocestoides corti]
MAPEGAKPTSKSKILPRVDCEHEGILLPLDCSFYQVKTPMEILRCPPRISSPLGLANPKDASDKWLTTSLKLNNNSIEDLDDLPRAIGGLFPSENWLTWLDLSCNLLPRVPPELLQLTNLKILYLHSNRIKTTKELIKLQPLQNLTKLTAHGNPAELEPGYFVTVLSVLPNLLKLDFTGISLNERLAASRVRQAS